MNTSRSLAVEGRCFGREFPRRQTAAIRKASAPEKEDTSRSVEISGSGLFAKNPKSNVGIVKTGILSRFRTMLFKTT